MSRHLCLIAALSSLFLLAPAAAQPPYPLPESATNEQLQQVVVPLSDAVRRRIEEALQRQNQGDPNASTGDPVLDDVLDVIHRQGSVLDGSSLDPQAPLPHSNRNSSGSGQQPDDQIDAVIPVSPPAENALAPPPVANFPASQPALGADARFQVAESLLKAARELASLPGRDGASNSLVAAMREQATMLLIDEYSEDTNRFE